MNNEALANMTQNSFAFLETYVANPVVPSRYLVALIIFVGFWLISEIVLFILSRYIKKLFEKTKTDADDKLLERTKKPIIWWLRVAGFRFGLSYLGITGALGRALEGLLDSIQVVFFMYILVVIVDIFVDYFGKKWADKSKSNLDDQLLPLAHKVVMVIMFAIGVIWVIKTWGIDIGPFLASLGLAGLALSFALQDSLKNIFGGVALILDKNFNIGDIIKLSSGVYGTVLEVSLRSTKIKSWDGEMIVVPNGQLANDTIWNVDLPKSELRVVINVGVAYGSDVDKAKKIIIGELKKDKNILKEPEPTVEFVNMGDFSLNLAVKYWVPDSSHKISSRDLATTNIYNAFNKEGITIPFPTRTIHMKKD